MSGFHIASAGLTAAMALAIIFGWAFAIHIARTERDDGLGFRFGFLMFMAPMTPVGIGLVVALWEMVP